jgi:poly(3-hydroxybutyrate) depolymerase
MLLHGCDQHAEEFVDGTRFTTVADRHGIVLVAPEQTSTATRTAAGAGTSRATRCGGGASPRRSPGWRRP